MRKVAALCVLIVAAFGCKLQSSSDNAAPRMRGQTSEGKQISIWDLTKDTPVFIVFLDPSDKQIQTVIDEMTILELSFGGKMKAVAVVKDEDRKVWEWARTFDPKINVISDQFGEFIGKYKAEKSRACYLVDRSKAVVGSWPEANADVYNQVREKVNKLTNQTVGTLSFPGRDPSPAPAFADK